MCSPMQNQKLEVNHATNYTQPPANDTSKDPQSELSRAVFEPLMKGSPDNKNHQIQLRLGKITVLLSEGHDYTAPSNIVVWKTDGHMVVETRSQYSILADSERKGIPGASAVIQAFINKKNSGKKESAAAAP